MTDIAEQGPVWSLLDAEIGIVAEGAITWHDILYVRAVNADPQLTTITFEGDDTSTDVDELNKVNLEVAADMWDYDLIQAIFGKSKVTGIAGEDWGMYFGDDQEAAGKRVALRYSLKARDQVGNTLYTLRYYWLGGIVKMIRPQTAEWKAKHAQVLNFSFEKSTKDINNVALAGVPSGGAYVRVARLAAA
jgi:hypothetical protein